MTLTPTPEVKAAKGFQPTAVSSLKRVVRPIQRKQRTNAQPRRDLIGLMTKSSIPFRVSGSTVCTCTKVIMIEAMKKPKTNLGKRSQITPALGFVQSSLASHMVTETIAKINAQSPTKMSRPTTFIRVKVSIPPSPN